MLQEIRVPDGTNHLIDAVPPRERERLLGRCESVDLAFGTLLCEQHQPYPYALFPLSGFISLVARVDDHPPMELAMIGNEGMLGTSLLLGTTDAPHQAVVQGAGTALTIDAEQLQEVLADSPVLAHVLNHYFFDLLIQLSQTTVCTRFHQLDARLARWLLMGHDRTDGDRLQLTHQFLADMLGVRRSAVTIASGILKHGRLIDYSRGEVLILDRAGLERAACGCYATLAGPRVAATRTARANDQSATGGQE